MAEVKYWNELTGGLTPEEMGQKIAGAINSDEADEIAKAEIQREGLLDFPKIMSNAAGMTSEDVGFALRVVFNTASGVTIPSFLTLVSEGTTANLSWSNPSAVSDFNIYQDGLLISSVSGETSASVSGLNAGTAYSFTVRPVLDGSVIGSAESNIVSMIADSSPLSYLNPIESAVRSLIVDEFDNDWDPDIDNIVWDDVVTISGSQELYNFWFGTAVGGVTVDDTRNQRIVLSSSWVNDRDSTLANDRLRGKNWLDNGKVHLIESESTTVRMNSQMRPFGARGIYWRNIEFSQTVTEFGGNPDWNPGANTIVVYSGGSGFSVGEILSIDSDHSTIYENPVLRVASVDGSGAITSVVVDSGGTDYGVISGNTYSISVSSNGSTSNGSLTIQTGVNPRDSVIIDISRTSSFSNFPVMIFENCKIGSGYYSSEPSEWMTGISANNCEQVTLKKCLFNGCQTANKIISTRRFRRSLCDYQNIIGDMCIALNTGATSLIGGISFETNFGDSYAYHYADRNTARNLYDNSNAVTSSGKIMGLYLEHTDFGQHGTSGDTGPIRFWAEYNVAYLERSTFRDAKGVRYSGGTQGSYNDDTNLEINGGSFSNIIAATASATFTGWNSERLVSVYDTALRCGTIPPNGDGTGGVNTNLDVEVGFLSRKKSTFTGTAEHIVRKGVMGTVKTVSGTGYVAGNLSQEDNVLVPAVGGAAAYAAAFPEIGAVDDAQGRMSYSFTDDGQESQSEFRSRMYSSFGQADAGAIDPAQWISI